MIRSNAEVTPAIPYPGLAAFPTRGVQVVSALLGEPLAEGSHSSAAVTKPDCHLDNLKTCIVEHKGYKQLSLHILPNIAVVSPYQFCRYHGRCAGARFW